MKASWARLACGLSLLGCEPLHDLDAASSGIAPSMMEQQQGNAGAGGSPQDASPSPSPSALDSEVISAGTHLPEMAGGGGSSGSFSGGPSVAPFMSTDPVAPTVSSDDATPEPSGEMPAGGDPQPFGVGGSSGGQSGSGGTPGLGGVDSGVGGTRTDGAGGADAGGADVGGAGVAGNGTTAEPPTGDAPELDYDFLDSPVQGAFTVSEDAEWEVDGVFLPTFEIHTPSASYWLVKSLGTLVSMSDRNVDDTRQWIDFSSGFRPLRGLPSLGTFGDTEEMTTTVDEDSRTPSHLRLLCEAESGRWRFVYDFYPTHVTLTVNTASAPYGIAYRGVPAGLLDDGDQFVLSDGTSQPAMLGHVADLAGPAEWAYLVDTTLERSFYFIQHQDDAVTDRYQVRDNDSAMFSFGDGELMTLPLRFSFGILESADHETVSSRVEYVISKIQ